MKPLKMEADIPYVFDGGRVVLAVRLIEDRLNDLAEGKSNWSTRDRQEIFWLREIRTALVDGL